MEDKFCQSCGMPLTEKEIYGTNADGTLNEEYCIYCFRDGKFTQDITMEQMVDHCLLYLDEFNKDSDQKLDREEAREQMLGFFPLLKRWKKGSAGE